MLAFLDQYPMAYQVISDHEFEDECLLYSLGKKDAQTSVIVKHDSKEQTDESSFI